MIEIEQYFEDYEVGSERVTGGRTITETDMDSLLGAGVSTVKQDSTVSAVTTGNATANTGGGAGGASRGSPGSNSCQAGGNGGKGIVIIRYKFQ